MNEINKKVCADLISFPKENTISPILELSNMNITKAEAATINGRVSVIP